MSDYIAQQLSQDVLKACRDHSVTLSTAESCTGGLIIAALTDIAGSSDVVDRGFITYSNIAKHELLNVPLDMLRDYGAVSREVAISMAEGGLKNAHTGICIAVTGVAGPDGGSIEKPVGLVHMAVAQANHPTLHQEMRYPYESRHDIRMATVTSALQLCLKALLR